MTRIITEKQELKEIRYFCKNCLVITLPFSIWIAYKLGFPEIKSIFDLINSISKMIAFIGTFALMPILLFAIIKLAIFDKFISPVETVREPILSKAIENGKFKQEVRQIVERVKEIGWDNIYLLDSYQIIKDFYFIKRENKKVFSSDDETLVKIKDKLSTDTVGFY